MEPSNTTLPAVLQYLPEVFAGPELPLLLCSMEPVCQEWRAACASCWPHSCLDVVLEVGELGRAAWQRKVASFAAWLPNHAALVRSISVTQGTDEDNSADKSRHMTACDAAAQQALAAALSRAMQPTGAPPAAAAATAAAQQQQQLHLQSYSSDCMAGGVILEALQASAHALTSLQLNHWHRSTSLGPCMPRYRDLTAAFQQLRNLQSLQLVMWHPADAMPPGCIDQLAAMTGLSSLHLGVQLRADGVAALQAALQLVPLQRLRLSCDFADWQGLDLAPLSRLSELQFDLIDPVHWSVWRPCGMQLPTQLKVLTCRTGMSPGCDMFPGCSPPEAEFLATATDAAAVGPGAVAASEAADPLHGVPQQLRLITNFTQLQQLQAFSLSTYHGLSGDQAAVAFLQQLPDLVDVSLTYRWLYQGFVCADEQQLWGKLKQLRCLAIRMESGYHLSRRECRSMLQGIGAATGLTALKLNINMLGPSHWLLARRDTHRYAHGAVLDDDNDGDGDADDALLDEQANPAPLEVFGHLTGLTALRELDLQLGPAPSHYDPRPIVQGELVPVLPGSAIQLTGLTCLTCLQLKDFGQAVDDAAVLGFASTLTNLESLNLSGCSVSELQLVQPLCQQLPRLTELLLSPGDDA